ncbi:MAG: ankyrin repeat domain-containing protein [Acidobacteriia bacterium]|nr:ankyrin repeat domain-containing protein [Terriglobia bacterium]
MNSVPRGSSAKTRLAALLWLSSSLPVFSSAASSPVADAAMNQDRISLRTLIAQHADVNAPQADGATALHWAAHWNDEETAALLMQAGAHPSPANRNGATPLFLASENGNAVIIRALLDAGADVNAPVLSHGETALMLAARSGNPDAVMVLLDRGARVDTKENLRGTTALMWAAEQGHAAVAALLIRHGASVDAQSSAFTPIRRRGLGFAPAAAGGQPNGSGAGIKGGLTPLIFAARQGALDAAKTLVAAGAGVNQVSADGTAPLLAAVQNGFYDVAKFLLDHGADPNLANAKGWTPLYLAVKNRNVEDSAVPGPKTDGSLEFIKLLLDRGANPNQRIKADTELHQGMLATWLKEAGATPLIRASLCGDLAVARLLLAHDADPSIATNDHTTALMAASGVGWAEGFLHEYSEDATLELIQLLIDAGNDVKAANEEGITALHGAAYKGANRAVQLLVDHGADLAAKDNGADYGFGARTVKMTALNWAEGVPIGMSSSIYHTETVALLRRLMQERSIPVVTNAMAKE